jgi:hypothetical protein
MAIDTLFAAAPTVINATYDKVWVSEIVISAPDLGGDAQARVLLRKFRSTESGAEFSPEAGEWITVDSLLAGAESDPDLAAAVGSLMSYVAKVGIQQGVIAPPAA